MHILCEGWAESVDADAQKPPQFNGATSIAWFFKQGRFVVLELFVYVLKSPVQKCLTVNANVQYVPIRIFYRFLIDILSYGTAKVKKDQPK